MSTPGVAVVSRDAVAPGDAVSPGNVMAIDLLGIRCGLACSTCCCESLHKRLKIAVTDQKLLTINRTYYYYAPGRRKLCTESNQP